MSRFRFDTGATADILSPAEHEQSMWRLTENFWTAQAEGIKHIRIPSVQGTAAAGKLSMGLGNTGAGPQAGFAWSVQRLVIWGLSTADEAYVYLNSATGVPVWSLTGAQWGQTFSKLQLTMYGGDKLVVAGTITATGTITLSGEAIEVPAEMLWKLA